MTDERIISWYTPTLKRTDVVLIRTWSLFGVWNNLLTILFPGRGTRISVYSKSVPLSRNRTVRRINEWIEMTVLRAVMTMVPSQAVLWIRHPRYYALHNRTRNEHLVFDCVKPLLQTGDEFIRYREYFQSGWIFAYHITDGACTSTPFRNKSEREVVKELFRQTNT